MSRDCFFGARFERAGELSILDNSLSVYSDARAIYLIYSKLLLLDVWPERI